MSTPNDLQTLWDTIIAGIKERDTIIDSWNPETGVKKQFLADLVAENSDQSGAQVAKLTEQLKNFDERQRYSLYFGLVDGLKQSFGKDFDKFVDATVETLPKPEKVVVDEETRKTVTSERSDLYSKAKQVKELAVTFDVEGSENWVMPGVRRAGSGKRGKRALSLYTWAIDGNEVSGDDNTPAGVAKLLGFERAGDFTKALKECTVTQDDGTSGKLNTSKPPREFEVSLRGKVITASRVTDEDVDDSDEDEDDDDENGDDE